MRTAKYFIPAFLIFSLMLVFSVPQRGSADTVKNKTVKIKCAEMSCAGCKKKITQSIKNLDGIKKVDVNLETKIITVTFDEAKTAPDKIVAAISDAGYESEIIE